MTTITIQKDIKLPKTKFKTIEELLKALKKIAPLKFYQEDASNFSENTLQKIENSKNNPNRKLTDFQG